LVEDLSNGKEMPLEDDIFTREKDWIYAKMERHKKVNKKRNLERYKTWVLVKKCLARMIFLQEEKIKYVFLEYFWMSKKGNAK